MKNIVISLPLLAIAMAASCSDDLGALGSPVADCALPAQDPATLNLPDGGPLVMFQTANSTIAAGEDDTYTITLDCKPAYGFQTIVRPANDSPDLDVERTVTVAGQTFTSNQWGPGESEAGTTVIGQLPLPAQLTIQVRGVGGTTGNYTIVVNPNPMPTQ